MGSLLLPTPDYVRRRRLELKLSQRELSRRMGYSGTYVGLIEQESWPVTAQFARRFWAVTEDTKQKRTIMSVIPLSFGINGDEVVHVLREPVECECGCGSWFVPNSWNHRWLDRKHRRRKVRNDENTAY